MTINLIDTHAHLDMTEFDNDRDVVIARAVESGVERIITVGTDVSSSRRAVALAEKYPQIFAAVGVHPHDADRVEPSYISELRQLAKHPKVVAIGEIGLDFYRNYSSREAQLRTLRAQLELSAELKLPVIIHTRRAARETIQVIEEWIWGQAVLPERRGVIHCFSEDAVTAKKFLDLGFYLSFPGFVTYPQNKAALVARSIPIEKILVETDCPFLPPQKYRGKRNEPSYVVLTAEKLAAALGLPIDKFAAQTTENALRLFNI
jgi:TatD DNase family protein